MSTHLHFFFLSKYNERHCEIILWSLVTQLNKIKKGNVWKKRQWRQKTNPQQITQKAFIFWVTSLENSFFPGFPLLVDSETLSPAGSIWTAVPVVHTWMVIETPTPDPSPSLSPRRAWMTRKWRRVGLLRCLYRFMKSNNNSTPIKIICQNHVIDEFDDTPSSPLIFLM